MYNLMGTLRSITTCVTNNRCIEDFFANAGPNPFLRSGEVGSCRVDKAENECYMRVDVPGVAEADMKVWTESGFIYFHAQGSELPEYNYQGRVFGGSISFDKDRFDSDGVRAEVKDGVLWLLVPRVKN